MKFDNSETIINAKVNKSKQAQRINSANELLHCSVR